jgi:hypothetical protein
MCQATQKEERGATFEHKGGQGLLRLGHTSPVFRNSSPTMRSEPWIASSLFIRRPRFASSYTCTGGVYSITLQIHMKPPGAFHDARPLRTDIATIHIEINRF